ncbi:tyrosine-type recombinase/integrase [Yersinia pseudotuberculosis]|uniref:tyrosine-type recombinase/integrase n=1 Tax=Yersinia pseudotuberculosis TaxID=633 RepID=UPI003995B532
MIDKCKSLFGNTDFVLSTNRGGFVAERTMTEGFMNARLKSGLQWKGTPPSFHEIRSLSARLYTDAKGGEFAQHLLGHKSAQMTAKYQDSRGSEWDDITI